MSNSLEVLCSFNSNADTAALCTSDGVVKFYDTLNSALKLEYASSTHLQASCTCLSWSKHRKKSTTNARKKIKKSDNIENELIDLDLIAIGTAQGIILLYSVSKAALHSQLTDGHNDKVNDVCWSPSYHDAIYSCAEDGQIVEWSLIEGKIKQKWKGSKSPVTSIVVDRTSKYLLSASKTITLWDLETRNKLKTFTGHSNDIYKLEFISLSGEDDDDDQMKSYFISAAYNDRVINVWQYDRSKIDTNEINTSLMSFIVNDNPIYIDINKIKASNQEIKLCVVTSSGHLCIYKHALKSTKSKKPIKPLHDINIETEESLPLNIISCQQIQSDANYEQVLITYGTYLAPKFEKLNLNDFNDSKILIKREDPYKLKVTLQAQVTKIETPNVPSDIKVLVSGYMVPLSNNAANAKRKSTEPSQMSLEERLNAIGIDDNNAKQTQQIPKTDNLLVLLVQGLQSNDAKTLNYVLQHRNDKVIAKTVRLLPTNYILTLFKELSKRLQGHAQSGLGIIKWLKCVLMTHTSYLMSYPDLIDSLGTVYEMMNARTKLFPQLSKLQGKLQLVMSQLSAQAEAIQTGANPDSEALTNYQDSTSEDEQIEVDLIPSHSENDSYIFSDDESDKNDNSSDDNNNNNNDDDDDDDENDSTHEDNDNRKENGANDDDDDDDDDDDEDDDDDDIDTVKLKSKLRAKNIKTNLNNKNKT